MSNTVYCKYCHHNWKSNTEYEKHIRCCEYFFKQRRAPEMTENGVPLPNLRQLYRYVQELTNRLEKTEKELKKMRGELNSRKRMEISTLLNQSEQIPAAPFEDWARSISANETDLKEVLDGSLTDGILSCLYSAIRSNTDTLPIRCFTQKPGVFYVYSLVNSCEKSSPELVRTLPASHPEFFTKDKPEWRQIRSDQFLKLLNHISAAIRRVFRIWNLTQVKDIQEYDTDYMDKMPKYMKKINADVEKLAPIVKKCLFAKLEESVQVIMEGDFE